MGRKHEMFFKGFGLVIIVVKAIKSFSLSISMCVFKSYCDVSSIFKRRGMKLLSKIYVTQIHDPCALTVLSVDREKDWISLTVRICFPHIYFCLQIK